MTNRPLGLCEVTTTIILDGLSYDVEVVVDSLGGGVYTVKQIYFPTLEAVALEGDEDFENLEALIDPGDVETALLEGGYR